MVEPTACAVHGMQTLAMKPASRVLLFGAGPTGQVLAQLLKLNGASHLTVAAPAVPSLESGKVKVDEIVTHEIPLRDYQKALDLAFAREAIKIAIIP
jgi:D-arabinitol dehydrogenase (NADP+)